MSDPYYNSSYAPPQFGSNWGSLMHRGWPSLWNAGFSPMNSSPMPNQSSAGIFGQAGINNANFLSTMPPANALSPLNMYRAPITDFSTMSNYAGALSHFPPNQSPVSATDYTQLGRHPQYPFNIQQSPIQNSWLYNTPQNPQVASPQTLQINPSVADGRAGNFSMNDYGLHMDIPDMANWRNELAKSRADFYKVSSELANKQDSGIGNWSNFLFGDQYHQGALGIGADVGKTIMGGILGWKNMQLANDQFNFSKDAYYKNMQNQTKLTNRDILENQKLQHRLDPKHFDDPNDPKWREENLL